MIRELVDYLPKMARDDRETLEMFRKRDRDDEELDVISQQRLQSLHETYIPKREKKDLNALLRKLAAEQKRKGSDE